MVVLLAVAVPAANASVRSPQSLVRPNTLVPNLRMLDFKLGVPAPAAPRLTRVGTLMYRTVDNGVPLRVWTNTKRTVVERVDAEHAGNLRLDGKRLNAGYRSFRAILTPEGWKSFGCGKGARGLEFTSRSGSLSFLQWSKRGVRASISLRSQLPLGVCEGLYKGAPHARRVARSRSSSAAIQDSTKVAQVRS